MPIPSLQLQKKAVIIELVATVSWTCLPAFQLLLEAGRPAFQLSMFAKADAQPKGDVLYMFVSENPFQPFLLEFQAYTPYQKLELPERRTFLPSLH